MMSELATKTWTEVCRKSQLSPGTGVCALVNGKQVAIFWEGLTDQIFALSNYCPFGKVNMLSRGLIGDYKGELMVASPLYKQRFSLKTGQCLDDETVSIPTYPIKIEGDAIKIAA
ncbi:nitrite reductase small subunit NirD [Agarivorans sp. MS3-6]|uniref:nitrite reductase small subunit NirD n=1 Tax=Agarivorans sp. TSD2052 TaxID=2937286 RepID=UPI00200C4235|nr:nitrite reductase small subunit NirD [Agarivorans sp. TSD2052]UPW19070.1 nitrite reductase small subunit NirD [Agarivorans sp. TSD2052]